MAFKVKLPTMFFGAVYEFGYRYWLRDFENNKVPANLAGYEAEMEIFNGNTRVAQLKTSSGTLTIVDNRVGIVLSANATKGFSFSEATYELMLLPNADPNQARLFMYGTLPGQKLKSILGD